MFTGIIHYQGKISDIKKEGSGNVVLQFTVPPQIRKRLHVDDSISIDGVCLTIVKLGKDSFLSDVMPETFRLTTLGDLKKGGMVNLECSLRASDAFDGHFVMGHIDGVGTVMGLKHDGGSLRLSIRVSKELIPYIAKKGSIAVNGVSLTITSVSKVTFGVALIPHTLKKTNLDSLRIGSKINIEVDTLARIVGQYLKAK